MNWEVVGAVGSLLSGLAAVIALVTVLYALRQTKHMTIQTRLLADANMASVYEQVNAMMLEINRYFFDHPEWKRYFYEQQELPEDLPERERGQIETLAEMIADFIDLVSVLQRTTKSHSRTAKQHWAEWGNYTQHLLKASPCLRSFISERESWYDRRLTSTTQKAEELHNTSGLETREAEF